MRTLAGQWMNRSADGAPPNVVLDLDDGPDGITGSGRIFFPDSSPGTICEVKLPHTFVREELTVPLYWMPHGSASMVDTVKIRELFPNYQFADTAHISIETVGETLRIRWRTGIGTEGDETLFRSDMDSPSEITSYEMSWEEFKAHALSRRAGELIFRGQPKTYRTRTAFHRTYRKDLVKFVAEDFPVVYRQLSARTQHVFDLEKPLQRGAFWNLLQHHGYPTPLLDWSYSPFVAAFFAYRRRKLDDEPDRKVRIVVFEKELWVRNFNQVDSVNFVQPHFSILEALAIENQRAIPQQALSTLTNIDDVEGYIRGIEGRFEKPLIYAIDLDGNRRPHVMAELSLMGITAGSLFPGLDGACEELMGRFFHHQVPPQPPER